jgi:hypothetical protein
MCSLTIWTTLHVGQSLKLLVHSDDNSYVCSYPVLHFKSLTPFLARSSAPCPRPPSPRTPSHLGFPKRIRRIEPPNTRMSMSENVLDQVLRESGRIGPPSDLSIEDECVIPTSENERRIPYYGHLTPLHWRDFKAYLNWSILLRAVCSLLRKILINSVESRLFRSSSAGISSWRCCVRMVPKSSIKP